MNWITASAIVFISSILLYLVIRKNQLNVIPNSFNNLAMFAIPAISYLVIGILSNSQFYLQPYQIALIFVTALLFSYIGNVLSLYSIKTAPNPGYINAVNAASISILTLLSAYFFKDELTPRKLIGVVGVVVGLIMIFL